MTNSNLTTLGDFIQVLRRRWWIVVLVVVIALVSAYAYSKHQSPSYRADANVRLNAQPATNVNAPQVPNAANIAVAVANESLFATGPAVVSAAMKAANLNESPSTFLRHGNVTGDATNAILNFSYDAPNGPRAREIVNDWAKAYTSVAKARDINAINSALAPLEKSKKQHFQNQLKLFVTVLMNSV